MLADITNNLTKEPVVTNARQIPLLQLKDLDLQMIVPISKFSVLKNAPNYPSWMHYPKNIQFFFFPNFWIIIIIIRIISRIYY